MPLKFTKYILQYGIHVYLHCITYDDVEVKIIAIERSREGRNEDNKKERFQHKKTSSDFQALHKVKVKIKLNVLSGWGSFVNDVCFRIREFWVAYY